MLLKQKQKLQDAIHSYRLWRSDFELKVDEVKRNYPTFILSGSADKSGLIDTIKTKIFECQHIKLDCIEESELANFLETCDRLILTLEKSIAETNKTFLETHK